MPPSFRPSHFLTPLLTSLAFSFAISADPAPAVAPAHAASPASAAADPIPAAAVPAAADAAADAKPESQPPASKPVAKPKKQKTASASSSPKGGRSPASVVITVGPNKIRKRQIDTLVNLMVKVKRAPAEMEPKERQYLERMVATNLIGQELLDLEAKRLNVIADEKAIDSLAGTFKKNFPNDEAFRRALKEAGDTEPGLREKMARQIKADKLLNTQVSPVARPTLKEMMDFFIANKAAFPINDSLRACQIVFLVDQNAGSLEASKRKQLEQIRSELARDSGQLEVLLTHFVMKARDVSDGPEKKDGGDLQRFLPGDFNPEFKKQVTALKVGQMSPVFRTPLGWHLILLTEKNDAKFESYQLQVARALMAQKSAQAGQGLKKYLKTLADRYKVSYLESDYKDTSLAGVYEP